MLLRVVDFETTGGPGSEVIEVGVVDVVGDSSRWGVSTPRSLLLRPTTPIPPQTQAVHHISDADVRDAPPSSTDAVEAFINAGPVADVWVAHHCEFERSFLRSLANGPWICTVKGARRAWPQAPGHGNQVLRYWLKLDLDPALSLPAHRAGPDAYVTAHILQQLLQTETVEDLLEWTTQPSSVTFGRHKGKSWADVPSDYLEWMAGEETMGASRAGLARAELVRRHAASASVVSTEPASFFRLPVVRGLETDSVAWGDRSSR